MKPGDRVQIGPHHDLWMRGDRYGTILQVHTAIEHATVEMDISKNLVKISKKEFTNYGPNKDLSPK